VTECKEDRWKTKILRKYQEIRGSKWRKENERDRQAERERETEREIEIEREREREREHTG
jgi:hypothetical protein